MTTPNDPYRTWLEASAGSEDGHYGAGIGLGGIILIILLVALLF